jgi:hypothetical protein
MKCIITFSIALTLSLSGIGQAGLVFSQCLTFSGETNVNITGDYYSTVFTVPDGKVWKIEYAFVDYNQAYNRLIINDRVAGVLYPSSTSPNFPIWVKSGDAVRIRTNYSNRDYFISVLEFNIN